MVARSINCLSLKHGYESRKPNLKVGQSVDVQCLYPLDLEIGETQLVHCVSEKSPRNPSVGLVQTYKICNLTLKGHMLS